MKHSWRMATGMRRRAPLAGLLLALAWAGSVSAQIPGTIVKKDGQKIQALSVQWDPVGRAYTFRTDKFASQLSAEQVERIEAAEPRPLAAAIAEVKAGRGSTAIATLEKVVQIYTMIGGWDVIAARWLAEAYLKDGRPADAVKMCDKLIAQNPEAQYSPDLAPLLWDALLADNQMARLERVMDEAVKRGTRQMAAVAQMKRGDIQRKRGELKEALIVGYLRTAYFFRDVKEVQGEALYKSVKCLEELGQHGHADKMRKKLLQDYPRDPYAEKLRSGA
jgi:TolA-binding protein